MHLPIRTKISNTRPRIRHSECHACLRQKEFKTSINKFDWFSNATCQRKRRRILCKSPIIVALVFTWSRSIQSARSLRGVGEEPNEANDICTRNRNKTSGSRELTRQSFILPSFSITYLVSSALDFFPPFSKTFTHLVARFAIVPADFTIAGCSQLAFLYNWRYWSKFCR